MNSHLGQHQRAPTVRVTGVSPVTEMCHEPSNVAKKQPDAGTFLHQRRSRYYKNASDYIKETHNKILLLKLQLQLKDCEIADCESLLEKRASHVPSLSTELCCTKSALEDEMRLREAAERRIADVVSREHRTYYEFDGILKNLHACYEAGAALSEEIGGLKEINALLPNCLGETKKKLKDVHATMVSLRETLSENSRLTAELERCKKELDKKAHLYEDAQASNQKLENCINELQLRIEALTTDNDALTAENRALAEKQKDYDKLQEAKERLENYLKAQTNAASSMIREIHGDLSSVKDSFSQVVRESTEAFEDALQNVVTEVLQQRTRISSFSSRLQRVASDICDELAKKKEEVQRLSAQCAEMDSIIRDQRAEIEHLFNGITKFEQLATDCAVDQACVEAELDALRECLAAAQMEAVPAEEREKAALLLLKKETQIACLKRELQEKKQELASLTWEKTAAVAEAKKLREANRSLEELQCERHRRENMDDCTGQAEKIVKKIGSLEATLASKGEKAQKSEQLKAEVLNVQEKVHTLESEVIGTKDAEALKLECLEQLYQEDKEQIHFLKRAGSTTSSGITLGYRASTPVQKGHKFVSVTLQDVLKDMPKQEGLAKPSSLHILSRHRSTLVQASSSVAPVPANAPSGSMLGDDSLSELAKIWEITLVKPKSLSASTFQAAKNTDGNTCPTKPYAVTMTEASKQQQETKPQAEGAPRKGKRPGIASATTALSEKSTELEKKGDSSPTSGVPASASAPKKPRFF